MHGVTICLQLDDSNIGQVEYVANLWETWNESKFTLLISMVFSRKYINMGTHRQIIYNFILDQIKLKLIKKIKICIQQLYICTQPNMGL